MGLTGTHKLISNANQDFSAPYEIGDEFAEHIIKNRAGIVLRPMTLLKCDIWRRFAEMNAGLEIRGTVNFRRISDTRIFATGQPTIEGIENVVTEVCDRACKTSKRVTWLNLREEPLVYINGRPYCLRPSGMSLRNTKAFSGISWTRLQLLEDRLKGDVLAELQEGDGRILLHTETEEGQIMPVWEEVSSEDVLTISEIMGAKARQMEATQVKLNFLRIPITAEKMPDPTDLTDLLAVVLKASTEQSALILNDQLGRGRSTLTAVIVLLATEWIDGIEPQPPQPSDDQASLHYHIINSLLRVLPKGLEVKRRVDHAIDRCSQIVHLRDSIEEARLAAEDIEDVEARESKVAGGLQNLRRYFELMIFGAYLASTTPSIPVSLSFDRFVSQQPVLQTLAKDFDKEPMAVITPLQSGTKEGLASENEEQDVISNRRGSILSPFTMLKSDFFPGILKKSLPVHIEGMPNMRGVEMQLLPTESPAASVNFDSIVSRKVWGTGMPTIVGLRAGLHEMGAGPAGSSRVVWTSLREEPVLYVKGRPHVLRLADEPLTNVEATGISTEVVERMELALKVDILNEARARDNRILLHDEIDLSAGRFEVVPVWEKVDAEDVLTPREVSLQECPTAPFKLALTNVSRSTIWSLERASKSTMLVSPSLMSRLREPPSFRCWKIGFT